MSAAHTKSPDQAFHVCCVANEVPWRDASPVSANGIGPGRPDAMLEAELAVLPLVFDAVRPEAELKAGRVALGPASANGCGPVRPEAKLKAG